MAATRSALGDDRCDAALAQGRSLALDRVIELAQTLAAAIQAANP
jgi:hypothetical protein